MVKEGSFPPLGDWAARVREFAATCDRKAERYCRRIHREVRAGGRRADASLRNLAQRSSLAWEEMQPGLGRAAQEVRKAFHDARERFREAP